jgi:hypothetical protein
MKEHDGYEDLRGSGHRSIISYMHGRMRIVLQCAIMCWLGSVRVGVKRTLLVLAYA